MHTNALPVLFLACSAATAQQVLTVPAAYDANDAPSRLWIAGVTADLHQQIIVDARHLQGMAGRTITALLWRREASAETFAGGAASLTVRLAETTRDSLNASPVFAANLGASAQTVFAGTVSIPTAPALPVSGLTWDQGSTVRLDFTNGFPYAGLNLVVDLVGTAPGTPVPWWPADAAWDSTAGTVQSVGAGCGAFANAAGESSGAVPQSLVPGASAMFWAHGTEQGLAFLFLSVAPPLLPGIPLAGLLPGSDPACMVHLPIPSEVVITRFADVLFPGTGTGGGRAWFELPVPGAPWVLGAGLATQWLDLGPQVTTSNALQCAIAATPPTLGMCTLQNVAGEAQGSILTHVAHVLRFEYQ